MWWGARNDPVMIQRRSCWHCCQKLSAVFCRERARKQAFFVAENLGDYRSAFAASIRISAIASILRLLRIGSLHDGTMDDPKKREHGPAGGNGVKRVPCRGHGISGKHGLTATSNAEGVGSYARLIFLAVANEARPRRSQEDLRGAAGTVPGHPREYSWPGAISRGARRWFPQNTPLTPSENPAALPRRACCSVCR